MRVLSRVFDSGREQLLTPEHRRTKTMLDKYELHWDKVGAYIHNDCIRGANRYVLCPRMSTFDDLSVYELGVGASEGFVVSGEIENFITLGFAHIQRRDTIDD